MISASFGSNTLPVPQSYKAYTTLNRDNLAVLISSIFERGLAEEEFSVLPAASTMFLQVMDDGSLHGFVNDRHVPLVGCEMGRKACSVESFLSVLEAKTTYSDVETACQNVPSVEKLQ